MPARFRNLFALTLLSCACHQPQDLPPLPPPLPRAFSQTPVLGAFRRRYPDGWGWGDFSPVGFNRAHTGALLEIFQSCGAQCYSDEVGFFRKLKGEWTPVERVPGAVMMWGTTNLHYAGP